MAWLTARILTLNISRETLQHNSQLRAIARRLEKKIHGDLVDYLAKDREGYEKFFENFGRGLKYGIYTSYGMEKGNLAELLLFYSAKQQKMVTLAEYIDAAPADQKAIYYAAGESVDRLAKMPIVKSVMDKGYDVLLCTQDVDEFCMMAMQDYTVDVPAAADGTDGASDATESKTYLFQNVAGGDLDLETEDEKSAAEAITKDNAELFAAMRDALDGKVVRVAVSARLTEAPACVVADGPISLEMEKIMAMTPDSQDVKSDRCARD